MVEQQVPDEMPSIDRYRRPRRPGERLRFAGLLVLIAIVYVVCLEIARVDLAELAEGLPRLGRWIGQAWPPDLSEVGVLSLRAAETVAMGTIGVSFAALLALPFTILAARNVTPLPALYRPTRTFLNALRGIDAFVFALIFVAAVGLGPFAGVLGVMMHFAGSIAKLWSEAIEAVEPGPLDAVRMTGAGPLKVVRHALLPDVMPQLSSIVLYMWEVSVRASTVLGIVGAGGIGQELKNSIDLLDFSRVLTILALILLMVSVIDGMSAWARRRLT